MGVMTDTPKLWGDMTPEEKGALLLAEHEGMEIEAWGLAYPDMWCETVVLWFDDCAYRIKREPKRETVNAKLCVEPNGTAYHMEPHFLRGHYGNDDFYFSLTFDTIDGKLDPASIKIEEM
jgi:hypothetical protein